MAPDILAATTYVIVSATNVGSATLTTTGTPFCISELNNNGNYCWQVVPTGTIVSVTANLMASVDGVNWYILDTMNQGDTAGSGAWGKWTGWNASAVGNVSAGEMRWVMQSQANYLRIDVATVNGGGTVTGSFAVFEANR